MWLSALSRGRYTCTKIVIFKCLHWNRLSNFHQILHGAFSRKGIDNLFKWCRAVETRWLPCQYMVKTLKNLLLQNHENFEAESRYIALATLGYLVCLNDGRRLTFDLFTVRSNLRLYTFVWGNVEKSFSQYVLKTNCWNLQCMIKEVKLFRHCPNLWGCLLLPEG